jgi:hypothetical protein
MSGAAQANTSTAKATTSDHKNDSQTPAPQKQAAQLEEDDEFEDFPVEGVLSLPMLLPGHGANDCDKQIGLQRRSSLHPAPEQEPHICGRRAGMMMTRATSSLFSSSMFPHLTNTPASKAF